MSAPARTTIKRGLRAVFRAARFLLIAAAIGVCALILASFVLWDADFFTVRDRWENFKVAMFGDWQPKSRLVDGVDEINLFRRETVAGFGTIMTGARFGLTDGDMTANATSQWCYVAYGSGVTSSRVDLGTQQGPGAPTFSDFETIPQEVLGALGVSAARLADLAKANCRFGIFDIENQR
uniref:hypothetical protein n=1 Tax=Pararhizobium sp. IMCC3301 TaxID=3067904 RepID=UPI002742039F|nr:hypothetical protein [Pararhizobium sp. IMCC3301]